MANVPRFLYFLVRCGAVWGDRFIITQFEFFNEKGTFYSALVIYRQLHNSKKVELIPELGPKISSHSNFGGTPRCCAQFCRCFSTAITINTTLTIEVSTMGLKFWRTSPSQLFRPGGKWNLTWVISRRQRECTAHRWDDFKLRVCNHRP